MKPLRIISLVAMLYIAFGAYAKKKHVDYPRADIKIAYNYHKKFLRGSDEVIESDIPFLLLSNSSESKFFCPHTEYKDSLQSTPQGRALYNKLFHEAIRKYSETEDGSIMDGLTYKTQLYVFKSFVDNHYDVYDYVSMEGKFHYTDPIDMIDWTISDSTKTVLGYECFMAEGDYHGRHWTVWFTPEIPIQNGPWKLQGLPGLILEATETSGQHTFTATGIEKSSQEMVPVYDKNYDNSTRINMLKSQRYFFDNQNSMLRTLDIEVGPDAPKTEESRKYDFLETDYH